MTINPCVVEKQPKKTLGKLKIEIKKIEKYNSRHVTFTKRRNGLFKKATELSVKTGAQVGILVESLGHNKVHTFGHPNIDTVIDRYLREELEPEKKETKRFDPMNGNFWWNTDVKDFDFQELQTHLAAMEQLKENVSSRAGYLMQLERSQSIPTCSAAGGVSTTSGDDCGLDHPEGIVVNDWFAENSIPTSFDTTSIDVVGVSTSGDDCGFDHPEGIVVNDWFAENSIPTSFDTTSVDVVGVSTSGDNCGLVLTSVDDYGFVHPEDYVDNEYLSMDMLLDDNWEMFDGSTVSSFDNKVAVVDDTEEDESVAVVDDTEEDESVAVVDDTEEDESVLRLWNWDEGAAHCMDLVDVIN